jgi:Tfp pilus assembly protein PilO
MALDWANGRSFRRGGVPRPNMRRGLPPLTPTAKVTAIGVAGLSAALAVAWFAVLHPRGEMVGKVDGQAAAVAASNDSLRNQIAARQAEQAQLPQLEKISSALDTRFPPNSQQAKLFQMITAAAASAGIAPQYLTDLTVAAPVGASTGANTSAHLPGVGTTIGQVASQQISLTARGTAADIRKFIANLEQLPRAFEITTVNLTRPVPASVTPAAPTTGGTTTRTTVPVVPPAPDANFDTANISGQMFLMPTLSNPTSTGGTAASGTAASGTAASGSAVAGGAARTNP